MITKWLTSHTHAHTQINCHNAEKSIHVQISVQIYIAQISINIQNDNKS